MRFATLIAALLTISAHASPVHGLTKRGTAQSLNTLADSLPNAGSDASPAPVLPAVAQRGSGDTRLDSVDDQANDVLTGNAGVHVWERLSNAQLFAMARTSKGLASAPPRLTHIRGLLAAKCPLSVKASLFPTEFLDLDPANAGVLTIKLTPSLWAHAYGTPQPLFARHGRSPTNDLEPCIAALAKAFADPRNNPLKDITTLRLLGHSLTLVGPGIQRLVRIRAEQGNPLTIQADETFLPILSGVSKGSFTELFLNLEANFGNVVEWTRFLADRLPTLSGLAVSRLGDDQGDYHKGLEVLSNSLRSSQLKSLTLPYVFANSEGIQFPPGLRRLTLDAGSLNLFSRACTASLESLTVDVDATSETFEALVLCMRESPNLVQLDVNVEVDARNFPPSAIPAYEAYLHALSTKNKIRRVTIPKLGTRTNLARVPSFFPHVTYLTRNLLQATAQDLASFPSLTHLALNVEVSPFGIENLGAELFAFGGRQVTHLDFSLEYALSHLGALCEVAARTDTFVAVEHLRVMQDGFPLTSRDLVRCFLDAPRPALRTINGFPVSELRLKFERAAHLPVPLMFNSWKQ